MKIKKHATGCVFFLAHSIAHTSSLMEDREQPQVRELSCMLLNAYLEGAHLPCKENHVKMYCVWTFQITSYLLFQDCLGRSYNKMSKSY